MSSNWYNACEHIRASYSYTAVLKNLSLRPYSSPKDSQLPPYARIKKKLPPYARIKKKNRKKKKTSPYLDHGSTASLIYAEKYTCIYTFHPLT